MIIKKKVGESTPQVKDTLKKISAKAVSKDTISDVPVKNFISEISTGKKVHLITHLDLEDPVEEYTFIERSDGKVGFYRDYIKLPIDKETGWDESIRTSKDLSIDTFLDEELCGMIRYYDHDGRMEKAFLTFFMLNTPLLLVAAVDAFQQIVIKGSQNVDDPSINREIIFVRTIQFLSLYAIIADKETEYNYIFDQDLITEDAWVTGVYDHITFINTKIDLIEPQILQKLIADGLKLKTITEGFRRIYEITDYGNRWEDGLKLAWSIFNKLSLAYIATVTASPDKHKVLGEAFENIYEFLWGEFGETLSSHEILTYSVNNFMMLITSFVNTPTEGNVSPITVANELLNPNAEHSKKPGFAPFFHWIAYVTDFYMQRNEEINKVAKETGVDVTEILFSVDFFNKIYTNIEGTGFFESNRVVITYLPITTLAEWLRVLSVTEFLQAAAALELLRNSGYTVRTIGFYNGETPMSSFSVENPKEEMKCAHLIVSVENRAGSVYSINIRNNLAGVSDICSTNTILHFAEFFNGQLIF